MNLLLLSSININVYVNFSAKIGAGGREVH